MKKILEDIDISISNKMLMVNRTIFLVGDIDMELASRVKMELLLLDQLSNEDITLMIDSGGGDIYSSFGIIDIMDSCKSDIITINMGLCASMAAIILMCGTKGKRLSYKRSRVMMHQPLLELGYDTLKSSDLEVESKELSYLRKEIYDIISEKTGKKQKQIHKDCVSDYYLNVKESINYKIIDGVI